MKAVRAAYWRAPAKAFAGTASAEHRRRPPLPSSLVHIWGFVFLTYLLHLVIFIAWAVELNHRHHVRYACPLSLRDGPGPAPHDFIINN